MHNNDFTIELIVSGTKLYNDVTYPTRRYIPLTIYKQGQSFGWGTYDENLSIKNNSQYSLTFSIYKYQENKVHPLFFMITEGRRIRLTTANDVIDFIITGITPNTTSHNTVYQVTCQDVFSYEWSRHNISLDYSTDTPANIREHALAILQLSQLNNRYSIDDNLEKTDYVKFPNLATTSMVEWAQTTLTTMEVSASTPYNLLIKLAEQYNAIIKVTYPSKRTDNILDKAVITFDNSELISYKGYSLRPDVNLTSFSISRKMDNFCSILHMIGGETADGNPVSLLPQIPSEVQDYFLNTTYRDNTLQKNWTEIDSSELYNCFLNYCNTKDIELITDNLTLQKFFFALSNVVKSGGNFLYNFDYFKTTQLITDLEYNKLINHMNFNMRNANLIYNCYNHKYTKMLSEFTLVESDMNFYISSLAAEYASIAKQITDHKESNSDLIFPTLQQSVANIYEYLGYYDSDFSMLQPNATRQWSGLASVWFADNNVLSNFIPNICNLYGTIQRSDMSLVAKYIVNQKAHWERENTRYQQQYNDAINQANALLDMAVPPSVAAESAAERRERERTFSESTSNRGSYTEYCYQLSLAKEAELYLTTFIDIDSDIYITDSIPDDGLGMITGSFTKKGICDLWIEQLDQLDYFISTYYASYLTNSWDLESTIVEQKNNLLNEWSQLYYIYGDYISESSFTDETQLTSEGLYIAAQRQMALYCNPTVDYSTTILNLDAITNIHNTVVKLGDIVRFYNKELYSTYNGYIDLYVDRLQSVPNFITLRHYTHPLDTPSDVTLTVINVSQERFTTKISCVCPLQQATNILQHPYLLVCNGQNYTIIDKQLGSVAQPIDLQVTGITTKLREHTTQLTVSNNRTIQNLLGRLLRPVK